MYDCLDIYIVNRNYNYDVQTYIEWNWVIVKRIWAVKYPPYHKR